MKARYLSGPKMPHVVGHVCVLIILSLVSSCGKTFPEKIGVSGSYWDNLTSSERQAHVTNFEKIDKLRSGYYPQTLKINRSLSVKINNGTILMPPDFKPERYNAALFTLKQDSCKYVPIQAHDSEKQTTLNICFWGHQVWLDPSNTDIENALYSARLFESSLWQRFTYKHINTSGYAGLSDANISIKLMS